MNGRVCILLLVTFGLATSVFGHGSHDHDHDHDHDGDDNAENHAPREPVIIGNLHKPNSCDTVLSDNDKARVKLQLFQMVLDPTTNKAAKVQILDKEKLIQINSFRFIEGVEQGIVGACVGEKRSLRIPASIGFGEQGSKKLGVAPDTDLRAVVEILSIEKGSEDMPQEDDEELDEDMDEVSEDGEEREEGEEEEDAPMEADDADLFFHSNVPVLKTSAELQDLRKRKNVLVMFYAPWCSHCTHLKPKYAQVALAFRAESDVSIVAIDATESEELAAEFEIEGYPSLFTMSRGKPSQPFEAPRKAGEMVRTINQLFNTERRLDGRLTEHAGTDEELNYQVDKWVHGEMTLEQLLAAIPEGSYYKRVAEMVQTHGKEKVLNERARLEKLLDGGSMKPAQLDSTQRRLNVLNAFHVEGHSD